MRRSLSSAYLAMIAVQTLHALEEFALEFWDSFPPMRAGYGGVPGLGEYVFVVFHTMLIGLGVWCYARWVRRGGARASTVVRAGVLVQAVTVLLHIGWLLAAPRYHPGLATTPLFPPAMAWAIAAARRSEKSMSMDGESGR